MVIHVRYFARLREEAGREGDTLEVAQPISVQTVWTQAMGTKFPSGTLVAINKEYADRDAMVGNGDEVAFFPPVTGG